MGFFSGLFGAFKPPAPPQPPKPYLPYNRSGVGHVLDVILDDKHPSYDPDQNNLTKCLGTKRKNQKRRAWKPATNMV